MAFAADAGVHQHADERLREGRAGRPRRRRDHGGHRQGMPQTQVGRNKQSVLPGVYFYYLYNRRLLSFLTES